MSKFGDNLRRRIPATGSAARALTIIYAVWLYAVITVIENVFNPVYSHHTPSSKEGYILLGFSAASWLVAGLISTLHEGMYAVLLFGAGQKQRQKYFAKMDERQLQVRRRIFEKSYAVLATLAMVAIFIGGNQFGNGLSQGGGLLVAINLLMLVILLPSLVASWEKGPGV